MSSQVHVIDHPLVQHKLTVLRRKETSSGQFRTVLQEMSMLLACEVTRDLPLTYERIETPLQEMDAPTLDSEQLVFVSILRAGNGILDGMLRILPPARVGHVGLYRDPQTLAAVEYYFKVPDCMPERHVIVVDPMLATGHSACAAVDRVRGTGPLSIKFCSILAAPEGVSTFHERHPDVPIYTAAIDERLDERGYILPGLGDAGDRIYGTV